MLGLEMSWCLTDSHIHSLVSCQRYTLMLIRLYLKKLSVLRSHLTWNSKKGHTFAEIVHSVKLQSGKKVV